MQHTILNRFPALSCLALSLSIALCTTAQAEPELRTISVKGTGKVNAPPDMATIITGVQTQMVTASEAVKANNATMARLLETLQENKIAKKDIQTSNFSVSPVYQRDPRNRNQNKVIGYRVSNQVRVRVRNLPKLGDTLDAVIEAGSNQISGVTFGVSDPSGLLDQARSKAIAEARSRAGVYAQAAGVKVGPVHSISEQIINQPRPQMYGRAMAMEMDSSVPIATGEQTFQATVHVVYHLENQ